jgi:pimeloyl-ACP methyl ester carboxylesterase
VLLPVFPLLVTDFYKPGTIGDPIFDKYFSATVQGVSVTSYQQMLMQAAGAALLDEIGSAIVLGHSSGGVMPWLWADARPDAVKAILAIEPSGPPFHDPVFAVFPSPVLGISDIPLTYSPPLANASSVLDTAIVPSGGDPVFEIQNCTLQAEPARQLVNLKNIPVLLTTAEASFHAFYDRCTVMFLQQAGVNVEWIPLQNVGIRGNGHFHFL